VEDSCEHGNERSCSIICWEVFEKLSDWSLLKKDLAPWRLVDLHNYKMEENLYAANTKYIKTAHIQDKIADTGMRKQPTFICQVAKVSVAFLSCCRQAPVWYLKLGHNYCFLLPL
jgi:hypothetical protein